jgi:hypothetical protein
MLWSAELVFSDFVVRQNFFSIFYGPQVEKVWETLVLWLRQMAHDQEVVGSSLLDGC